jgi:hypothetical protein
MDEMASPGANYPIRELIYSACGKCVKVFSTLLIFALDLPFHSIVNMLFPKEDSRGLRSYDQLGVSVMATCYKMRLRSSTLTKIVVLANFDVLFSIVFDLGQTHCSCITRTYWQAIGRPHCYWSCLPLSRLDHPMLLTSLFTICSRLDDDPASFETIISVLQLKLYEPLSSALLISHPLRWPATLWSQYIS